MQGLALPLHYAAMGMGGGWENYLDGKQHAKDEGSATLRQKPSMAKPRRYTSSNAREIDEVERYPFCLSDNSTTTRMKNDTGSKGSKRNSPPVCSEMFLCTVHSVSTSEICYSLPHMLCMGNLK